MRINISFNLSDGPCGGGNQFLKALKLFFTTIGCYTENTNNADIILYNSHQYIDNIIPLKKNNPSCIFIHRIDGPIRLYNTMSDKRDLVTYTANSILADATIFQSNWSQKKNYEMGLKPTPFQTTIINAPDPNYFNMNNRIPFSMDRKIRIIATSWSSNWKKGFKVYKWLDNHLNFSKYEMTFIGNSPIKFKNIHYIKPISSSELGKKLKEHDIFISASQKDPCSNSLIEAMHCGLPVLALNDGGHSEIVRNGGEFFENMEEIPQLLKKISKNYHYYQNNIHLPALNEVGRQYLHFMENIFKIVKSGQYIPKKLNLLNRIKLYIVLSWWNLNLI